MTAVMEGSLWVDRVVSDEQVGQDCFAVHAGSSAGVRRHNGTVLSQSVHNVRCKSERAEIILSDMDL